MVIFQATKMDNLGEGEDEGNYLVRLDSYLQYDLLLGSKMMV